MTDTIPPNLAPQEESLAEYLQRVRKLRGISQAELARRAKVNPSTVTRLENGNTSGAKSKKAVQSRLATALKIPVEYLDAAREGKALDDIEGNKICPRCWNPGTPADARWNFPDARFCLLCGDLLKNSCDCGEPILIRGKFCPHCGVKY